MSNPPCKTSNCPVLHLWPKAKAKQKTHKTKYHGNVTVTWEGQKRVVYRTPQGRLLCPCGDPSHNYTDSHLFEALMKKTVHPVPTDDVTLAHPESLLSADVTMDSPDDLCYTLTEPESDEGTNGASTEDEGNHNQVSGGHTIPTAQHSLFINTSTVSDLPTTSVRGALHARAHAPLEVTSTHGNTFSLTRSFKGDTLLNVHHSTPECKQKIEETNDDSFESDCESHAQQSDADDDDQLMTPIHPDLPSGTTLCCGVTSRNSRHPLDVAEVLTTTSLL
ncbi:hypothetical protein EDD22DRAFT_958994 [Suillus occidentalis]|nr:hypothetical protein EDD22DRAFT_958994 [Suillus occidentalis]